MATEFISNSWLMPTNANAEANRVSNYSLDFDGSNDSIAFASSVDLGLNNSVSMWVNLESGYSGALLGETSYGSTGYFLLPYASGFFVRIGTVNVSVPNVHTYLTANSWHNLTVVRNSGNFLFYVDGTFRETVALSSTTTTKFDIIGNSGTGADPIEGKITEVSAYDYALSAPQVTELYGTGSAIGNPMAITNGRKPVAYYPLGNAAFNSEFLVPNSAEKDFVFDFVSSSNQYIDVGNSNFPTGNSSRTMAAWIKADSSGQNNEQGIFRYGTKATRQLFMMSLAATLGRLRVSTYGDDKTYSTSDLRDDKWHHVALTYDGTSIVAYLDGANVGVETNTLVNTTNNSPAIGNWNNAGFTFNGNISNVQLWSSKLEPSEITTLYNNGTPYKGTQPQSANLQGWWELDASATFDGSNWSIPDASSNSNTGTSSGMTAANLVQSDLIINAPYDSFSLSFDGTDDYIETSSIDVTGNKSFSFWIKRDSSSPSNDGGILTIVPTSGTSDYISIALWQDYIQVQTSNTSTTRRTVEETISTDVWHHIVVIKSTNSIDNIYINGVNKTLSNFGTWTGAIANPQNKIAEAVFGVTNYNFNGKISNCSIYSSALSATQVTTLYNEGKPFDLNTFAVTPVSWWRLGAVNSSFDGTNWTVLDEIGTSNGTSANMTQADLVDGVGATGSGTSSGMSSGTNRTGNSPYSDNNAVSYNMSVLAKSTSVPT